MTKCGILAIRKLLMCIALTQTCLFHLSNMYFSDVCAENKKIYVVEMIFFTNIYNIKNWGHRPSEGDTRAKQVTLCIYIG